MELTRRLTVSHDGWMRITLRDAAIVRTVSRLRQVSTHHIDRLFFADNASSAPLHRTLARLHDESYLHRVERRMVGGNGRGSGQYVYSLGINGYRFVTPRGGKFTPARTVNYHTLAIADVYVALRDLEHFGDIAIERWSNESREIKVEEIEIRPDLEFVFRHGASRRHWWVEVDLATEDTKQLREKIERIVRASERVGVFEEMDGSKSVIEPYPFPEVIFLTPDQERINEIEYVLARNAVDRRDLFKVLLFGDISKAL